MQVLGPVKQVGYRGLSVHEPRSYEQVPEQGRCVVPSKRSSGDSPRLDGTANSAVLSTPVTQRLDAPAPGSVYLGTSPSSAPRVRTPLVVALLWRLRWPIVLEDTTQTGGTPR